MEGAVANRFSESREGASGSVPTRADEDPRAEAFRRLAGAELDRAYGLATAILGDRFDAEDAVHDAAALAWSRWADLRDPSRFEAWFGRIVINACRDRLRRRRRRVVEIVWSATDAGHPLVGDDADAQAIRDLLRRALRSLSPDERIAIALRFEADLTVPAIGRLIGVPEGTVKSRLHHALAKLRVTIGEASR
jgi:RNA polymerase sigma-70 factor (ECF subfamily)